VSVEHAFTRGQQAAERVTKSAPESTSARVWIDGAGWRLVLIDAGVLGGRKLLDHMGALSIAVGTAARMVSKLTPIVRTDALARVRARVLVSQLQRCRDACDALLATINDA